MVKGGFRGTPGTPPRSATATPTSSTRTIIVQVQRNVMKEHTGIYIHIAILYGHMLRVKMNFTVTFFTISCLQAVDYLQDNAIITGKHLFLCY